jgi:hypothetical protein
MSNILKHAERELTLIGYDGKDEYNNMAKDAILQLIETFAKQGHSGFSAPYVANMFHKLANYETLSPLTGNDDEWSDVLDERSSSDTKMLFQNTRDSRVFKDEKGAYFLNAIVWQEIVNGDSYHFTDRNSKRYIKSFPFTPKTFYVKIDEKRNVLDTEEYNKANEYYA